MGGKDENDRAVRSGEVFLISTVGDDNNGARLKEVANKEI